MIAIDPGVQVADQNAFAGETLVPELGNLQPVQSPGHARPRLRLLRGHRADQTELRRAHHGLDPLILLQPLQAVLVHRP